MHANAHEPYTDIQSVLAAGMPFNELYILLTPGVRYSLCMNQTRPPIFFTEKYGGGSRAGVSQPNCPSSAKEHVTAQARPAAPATAPRLWCVFVGTRRRVSTGIAMQVFARLVSGQILTIDVQSDDTVDTVCDKIAAEHSQAHPDLQTLALNGQALRRGATVAPWRTTACRSRQPSRLASARRRWRFC